MFKLEEKTYVIMSKANKRSSGFNVVKVLDEHGANLVFTYSKERSKNQLEKLFEELKNQDETYLYECDVQQDDHVVNAFKEIGDKFGKIDGVYHSIAFANMEDLRGRFSDTTREGFLLAQD